MKQNLILTGIVLLLLGAGILGCFLIAGNSGTTAVIYQDGQELQRVDLSAVETPYTITVHGENGEENVILIEPGAISMQTASCPDQLCVQRGDVSGGGLPIVCLPNHVVIEITGAVESDIDVIAY